MSNIFSYKKNICTSILFFYLIFHYINLTLNTTVEEISLKEINKPYTNLINGAEEEKCFSYLIELGDDAKIRENLYIHFSSFSETNKQMIFYSTKECPTALNAEKYNYKYSDLIINFPKNKTFYLTVKCNSYPCSFSLYTIIEKDYANLDLKKSDTYSYFVSAEDKISNMIFKIPSSMDKIYSKSEKHMLTISVTNPSDLDYNQLYLVEKGNKIPLNNIDFYKTSMDIIFAFIEEDYIQKFSENIFYALEINSIEGQFVSLTVKTSRYNIPGALLNTDIIPNTNSKYSYLFSNEDKKYNEECFKLNESYLEENLNDKDFLYASIEYFTYPINPYLKDNEDYKIYEYDIEKNQNSINIIIEKKSNKYPSICFNSKGKQLAFILQVYHISKENENIDIYNPLTSGFIHTKSLNKNNLALYTHISDIHYIYKLSYYLKVLKGNPEMYIVQCSEYPNCYNKIDDLNKDDKVIKPQIKDNIYRYNYSYEEITTDLSPFGTNQSLLYVYCPDKNNKDEFCQFQALIYSNLDEIVLLNNDPFYSYLLENEIDLYTIQIKKTNESINRIQITLNSTEECEFEYFPQDLENFEIKNITKDNLVIWEYIPYDNFSFGLKDYDIKFNIIAKKNLSYNIKYETILIVNLEFEKIKEIEEINYLPIKMYSLLPFNKTNNQYNFKELLFNFYFSSTSNIIPENSNTFEKIKIKATIITKEQLNNVISTKNEENIFNKNISTTFDLSTRTAVLNINKEFLGNFKNNEELILYFSINFDNNNERKKINLAGKAFLFYKNNTEFIIPENNYINDKLSINDNKIYNLYHLKLEEKENMNKNYVVEFSSNVNLDNDLFIYFIDYDNIKKINSDNISKNTYNIKNSVIKIGGIQYFEFTLKNETKDIILCVGTNLKKEKDGLSNINYIFKYLDKNNQKFNYVLNKKLNKKINHSKNTIELEKIQNINIYNKTEYPNVEIYIRKIKKEDKLKKELFNTISIIESDYELINGNISYENEKIVIDIPKMKGNEFYSVLINLLGTDVKFVYDTIIHQDKDDSHKVLIIVSISLSVIVIIIGIVVIFYFKRKRKYSENIVMKTSFENTGILDELNDVN